MPKLQGMTPSEAANALHRIWKSDPKIARCVGSTQSTINRIRRGRIKCDYQLGVALIRLAESEQARAAGEGA